MDKIIDLRSDTVTLPSPAMKAAIQSAVLGDDVFEEDPTINELERKVAALLQFDKALFVPSGTMSNLIAVLVHCGRGSEAIVGDRSHTFIYEAGGISTMGGVHSYQIPNLDDGSMDTDRIRAAIRDDNVHFPVTRLICLENTHNMCFGTPLKPGFIRETVDIARENNLRIHVDGARLFNAAAAQKVPAAELVDSVDSVSVCLSKGLSAPVGSLLCGSSEFIYHARRYRKTLGGGMRQAGVLAAAGIVALDEMIPRLEEDHNNARILADGLAQMKGIHIRLDQVHTNLVFFNLDSYRIEPHELVIQMEKRGVRFLQTGPNRFRMVTHYGIEQDDIVYSLEQLAHLV